MRIKYKTTKTIVPFCGNCDEQLRGNGSIVMPYQCSCGYWEVDKSNFVDYQLQVWCACMRGGKRNPIMTTHSEFECKNEQLGVLKI